MEGSLERVRRVMALEKPDRAPLFDLVPNDAVLRHFNDGEPVGVGDDEAGLRALAAAVDGSRWAQFSPAAEKSGRREDGRAQRTERWTEWTETRSYGSSEAYREAKERELAERRRSAGAPIETAQDETYRRNREALSRAGDDFYFLLAAPSPGLMDIWLEVGLEEFSYYLYDCEDLIEEQLELNTDYACRWLAGLPEDDPFEAV
ncbi:MAG: hypothetical protein MUQ65_06355, partial [Armatimonadetes bacterium]|nr:hypothetical protein [Armatimonadota bacterium]